MSCSPSHSRKLNANATGSLKPIRWTFSKQRVILNKGALLKNNLPVLENKEALLEIDKNSIIAIFFVSLQAKWNRKGFL